MRARVAYDGTKYHGWQFQANHSSIQATLEESISVKFGQKIRVVGASRTDSGVHARGQAMHFDVPSHRTPKNGNEIQKFQSTLNQMLPVDIRVSHTSLTPPMSTLIEDSVSDERNILEGEPALRPWHAIYNATGKLYTYRFSTGLAFDPLQRLYRYHEWRAARYGFSEEALRKAAARFVGSHDFSAFASAAQMPAGYQPPVSVNPIRTVHSIDIIHEGDGCYKLEFRIDGAFYKMIRNIVGTLLDVACGKLDLNAIDIMFESRDRRKVSKSAPAMGLCLEEVFYDSWSLKE